jgi:hypothetical protein
MLCSSCQDILSAKSEVISVDGDRKFKYHDNLQAFKTEAEAGCQLCLMGWYQLSDEVRRKAYEDTTPIFYTINEWNRKGGSYELAGGVETDDDTVYFHVEFVRSQGLQRLSFYGRVLSSAEVAQIKSPCRNI